MKKMFILVLFIVAGSGFAKDKWPRFLGPNGDGTANAPGLFGEKITLDWLWIKPLGSGFSGVSVSDGKVYAMHTAGKMDALSCFDANTGEKLWSFDYGPTFPKVGNSEPGPLSTPVVDGFRVYGLGAYGELFCLNASTGKPVWTRNIDKELGAVPREVGITTSPLVSGELLILNVGDRKDKGIAAFNKKTGELAWHLGEEAISFQTPSMVTLLGRKQLVTLSDKKMRGLQPTTGEILWEKDSKDWIQSLAIGDDLLLTGHYHGFALHQFQNPKNPTITELWYSRLMTLEYAMPVPYKGFLYGFKGGSLVCHDLKSGAKVWSSRKPGGGMTILVDGHLAILSPDGTFRIVMASEWGYEERASLKVFEKGGLTAPSYADGGFYLRNYTHLTAVRIK